MLSMKRRRQGHAHTRSRRLVHLSVDQAGLVDDARLGHLEEQVGTLAGTLAYAREHGGSAVLLGQVVDELLDEDRLADARSSEEAGLAATDVRLKKVDGLDARLEDFGLGGQLVERRRRVVNRVVLDVVRHLAAVNRLAHDVPHATEGRGADGHEHGVTGVLDAQASLKAVRGGHGDGPYDAAGQLRLDLENGADLAEGRLAVNGERRVDGRDLVLELHVDDRTDDTGDVSRAHRLVHLLVGRFLQRSALLLCGF